MPVRSVSVSPATSTVATSKADSTKSGRACEYANSVRGCGGSHGLQCLLLFASMFQAINAAAADLYGETTRVVHESRKLKHTLTCGELQEILDSTKKSTEELRRISFQDDDFREHELHHRMQQIHELSAHV